MKFLVLRICKKNKRSRCSLGSGNSGVLYLRTRDCLTTINLCSHLAAQNIMHIPQSGLGVHVDGLIIRHSSENVSYGHCAAEKFFFLIYVLLKAIPVNWGFVYIVIISMDIPIKFLVKHFMLIQQLIFLHVTSLYCLDINIYTFKFIYVLFFTSIFTQVILHVTSFCCT